jgi:hypothetical protein
MLNLDELGSCQNLPSGAAIKIEVYSVVVPKESRCSIPAYCGKKSTSSSGRKQALNL